MLKIQCITIDSQDPLKLAQFWREVLGWEITFTSENEICIELLDGSPSQGQIPDILFIKTPDERVVKNRLHLDLRPDDQESEVQRIERLGGKRIEIGQSASQETTWVVMADPEGNEFCVLRAPKTES
ncbi:MAG: VOC family protein [Candidatus Nanopelagicaceae bacterium]